VEYIASCGAVWLDCVYFLTLSLLTKLEMFVFYQEEDDEDDYNNYSSNSRGGKKDK
jgi:hypothetical protein